MIGKGAFLCGFIFYFRKLNPDVTFRRARQREGQRVKEVCKEVK